MYKRQDGARAPHAVEPREQVACYLPEPRVARVARHGFHMLQKAEPLHARAVRRLRANVRPAVLLGGDHHRVAQLRDAVLARNLPQRPGDVKRREIVRGLVVRLDRRRGQLSHCLLYTSTSQVS